MFTIDHNKTKVQAQLVFVHTTEAREFIQKLCRLNIEFPLEMQFRIDKTSRHVHISMPLDDDNRDNIDLMIAHMSDQLRQYQCLSLPATNFANT